MSRKQIEELSRVNDEFWETLRAVVYQWEHDRDMPAFIVKLLEQCKREHTAVRVFVESARAECRD